MTDDMRNEEERLAQDVQNLLDAKGKDPDAAADAREALADEKLDDLMRHDAQEARQRG